ncbi:MAG: MFS transporter [Bacteroidia bacterium]
MNSITSLFRNAFGGLSKAVWLLALMLFINRSGTMVLFFLSIYLTNHLHFTLGQTGVVMALFGAGSLPGAFFGGRLVDKIGSYPVMLWSLIAGGIMFIIVGQLHGYLILSIGVFLLSAISEAFRPANMAAISHYSTPETYTRSISLNRLAINLGFSIGPAAGGFLAAYSYSLIFWADGLTCIAAALALLLFIKKKSHAETIKAHSVTVQKISSPYRDKIYLFFLPVATLYAISFFQFFSTMPLYYKQVEHLTEKQIGWILALNGILVAAIEMIMIYKIEKRWTMYNFIALGASLLIISYLALLAVSGIWWLVVITVLISFSEMFALPFMNTFMNSRSDPENKGQYASLYVMSWSVALIATPIIATQVIAHFGYETLWLVLATFGVLVFIGIKTLERVNTKRSQ